MLRYSSLFVLIALISCKEVKNEKSNVGNNENAKTTIDSLIYPEEKHFKSLRQITFGGDNAEAYWSFDDKKLVFQSNFNKSAVAIFANKKTPTNVINPIFFIIITPP